MPVTPMISYEDGVAAMAWLARAFDFREQARMVGADGRLAHGEMETGDGVIMLATSFLILLIINLVQRWSRRHEEH